MEVRETIRALVALDARVGGDRTAARALRAFRSAPVHGRDAMAAAGELGEVTGWLLFDAGRHRLAERVNRAALRLSRRAGDRAVELLTLQNMALHAGYVGRPRAGLDIIGQVLSGPLSPRLEALFRLREARARALAGDRDAPRLFARVRSRYLDGVRDDDPAWTWWIDDPELAWHEAMVHGHAGDWARAADLFHAAAELVPADQVRRRYLHLAALLGAQARAGARRDAEDTLTAVLPYYRAVGSTRTDAIVRAHAVRITGPSAVMATVCSEWAARLPSRVRRVQPSSST
ncbi:hypothetical protein [Actinokineospora sp. UTMC 2448]|uniref:hypothetical protein n=1 Tax=Actinokineospora sp. UTMC 2448 TaxID=2268449 RepID=UPI002164D730|nr:hypothetical protein [Actinokineospora sp. UTMC 2448]UVS77837.1 hypothetical protein Actkin_01560 [Actinokineospora sp. UTMC 2448]